MKFRKGLAGLVAAGLAVTLVASTDSAMAAAKKTTKKKAKVTTTKKGAAAATTAAAPVTTAAAAGGAKKGGKIGWGLEAESSEGFLPSSSNCAVSCYQVFYSMAERLFTADAKGNIQPGLALSLTMAPDAKNFTIKLRKGIKFHNGEVFDAEAAKLNIDDFACGSVTLTAFLSLNGGGLLCKGGKLVTGVTVVSDDTIKITTPVKWVSLGSYLASGQTFMMAPEQIKAGNRNKPIGTGPFKFKEWVVGDHLTVVKNNDYWRGEVNLDEVTFRPIPDESARLAQLQSGQIDFMQTSNYLTMGELKDLEKAGKISLGLGSFTFGEVSYNMLNVATPPFNSKNCRLAAAYGLDTPTIIKLRAPGADIADGPFGKGALGALPDSGYPKFDLDKAKSFFAKCKADQGGGDVKFTLGTTTVPDNIQTAAIQKQMMEAVGFKVDTVNIEQQKYIGVALVGYFQWFQWRSHGGFDPDQQRVWWHSEMNPVDKTGKQIFDGKTISINFGRIADSTIDEAFNQIRTNSDQAVRKRAAESINRAFAEEAYNLWGWRTRWAVAACKTCTGYTGQKTPNGQPTQDFPTGHVVDMAALAKG